jgi:hypothetical protein
MFVLSALVLPWVLLENPAPVTTSRRIPSHYFLNPRDSKGCDASLQHFSPPKREDKRSVPTVVAVLERDARIATVQPNYLYRLQGAQNGPLAGNQYAGSKMLCPKRTGFRTA